MQYIAPCSSLVAAAPQHGVGWNGHALPGSSSTNAIGRPSASTCVALGWYGEAVVGTVGGITLLIVVIRVVLPS